MRDCVADVRRMTLRRAEGEAVRERYQGRSYAVEGF